MTARALEPEPPAPLTPDAPPGTIDRLVIRSEAFLTDGRLDGFLRLALGDLQVALCLHRVRTGVTEWLSIYPAELDALILRLRASRPSSPHPWLTVSFDDGYEDAVEYVASRAPRFPDIEWVIFVCPRHSEQRLHFSWDVGRSPSAELASVEALRRVEQLPNVSLGNHTNAHENQKTLSDGAATAEYDAAFRDFARLFGPQRHFAFPYGTPECSFEARHVGLLRARGAGLIWSTERRPFARFERRPGAVLPRFPIDGRWSNRQLAFWIALLALKFRSRGTRFHY